MTAFCGPLSPRGNLPQHSVTNRNKPLASCATFGSSPGATGFFEALHRRTTDRIAWPWARSWLAAHARLEGGTTAGWPVLRLVLAADPPPEVVPLLLLRQYRDALSGGAKSGPLADLAAAIELVVEAGR